MATTSSKDVIFGIAGKELRSFLGNPTGYVFLTLFIALCAGAAFWPREFFDRNLADLATLNRQMPLILMLFVPAITMTLWADERRAGTDELLLTLPVRDTEVVLGKFLGAVGVLSIGLAFSLANVAVLAYLGEPDVGLMFSTFLGYWLMGTLFVAVGMIGSLLTTNVTVAFVLGVLGCAAFALAQSVAIGGGVIGVALLAGLASLGWLVAFGSGIHAGYAALVGAFVGVVLWLGDVVPGFTGLFAAFDAPSHFASFGEGVIRLGDVVFFAGGTAVALYLCGLLLSRRHW
ncbi:ABC-type transport system involved in multi-copper enzyme maturation, permease component [Nannocystis exedens]|uniref:ABC-type transport system involved in multi-copper enzyme maturation, permease component n=1 Tax=Nannocystis exedens TaxID=54 RepID=A0A1I1SYB2_9BACT|nr:ABC transporter permease [Nannocystis exedens]PCC66902.1 permease of ABC transporter [Nannocystis exedens]SFD51449.1 ABC-type transport system involved in multi-copper enzyme maturation, permease component [Nannocystis exedens]